MSFPCQQLLTLFYSRLFLEVIIIKTHDRKYGWTSETSVITDDQNSHETYDYDLFDQKNKKYHRSSMLLIAV